MATLYLDFENGNDNYAGTSFALLAQGTNGRITLGTFSSAGASFPNDGSLIDQYLSIFDGAIYAVYRIAAWVSSTSLTLAQIPSGSGISTQAVDRQYYIGGRWKNITTGATAVRTIPGDTIRIMGSPAPTSLGQNGVWTSQALQASKSITSSTNATPIAITIIAHGYTTGDTVVITAHTTNTNANGTWEITSTGANTFTLDGSVGNGVGGASGTVRLRNNTRVLLTTPVTQNIASTGPRTATWTTSANVTATFNTSLFKEHTSSDSIAVLTAFTTGKAAYYTFPATLNLSAYQQVSFWIMQTSGTVTAIPGSMDLRLCSDVAGNTAVNTISIPLIGALNRWRPVTIDLGTALGSSIQSIAFYINTDLNAQTFLFNNIIACKASSAADSLTLTSLIGKNTTGETFWGIQSINGTRVMLDSDTNATTTGSVRGYFGTTGTVTTWKRETIKQGPAATSTTLVQVANESGTDGNLITFSGGWDRTDMSTQGLETWVDGQNGLGQFFVLSGINFNSLTKFSGVRFSNMLSIASSSYNNLSVGSINNCTSAITTGNSFYSNTLTIEFICANSSNGFSTATQPSTIILNLVYGVFSNQVHGIDIGSGTVMDVKGSGTGAIIANNGLNGVNFTSQAGVSIFRNLKISANGSFLSVNNALGGTPFRYFVNCLFGDSGEVLDFNNNYTQIASQNHDQTVNNHKIFMDGGLISSATDQRKTASGISWKLQPTSSTLRTSGRPVTLSLAKVACSANNLVTIKAWMYRDNAGLTMRLVCKGNQIAGVASDVVSALSTTNAWEEETITFTPTETGVVEITAEAWGGTTFSGWVDDMTISQA